MKSIQSILIIGIALASTSCSSKKEIKVLNLSQDKSQECAIGSTAIYDSVGGVGVCTEKALAMLNSCTSTIKLKVYKSNIDNTIGGSVDAKKFVGSINRNDKGGTSRDYVGDISDKQITLCKKFVDERIPLEYTKAAFLCEITSVDKKTKKVDKFRQAECIRKRLKLNN